MVSSPVQTIHVISQEYGSIVHSIWLWNTIWINWNEP